MAPNEHDVLSRASQIRVGDIGPMPTALAASFDAFEFIRAVAERCGNRNTAAFATWAMTGAEAADGRDVLVFAPSLPLGGTAADPFEAAGQGENEIADALTALATRLAAQLAATARRATVPGDKAACERAAEHAVRISQLLARDL